MKILGISCYYHDSAACLVKDGIVVAAAEEERFSRKKHDFGFPDNAISFCLKSGKIKADELDYIVFYEKPFLKLERLFLTVFQTYPWSFDTFYKSVTTWFMNKLWIKAHISEKLKVDASKILFVPHHLSHAASCYLPSGYKSAAILTNDGVGEWSTSTYGIGSNGEISIFKEMTFPHSVGLLYATITAFLGFEVNEGEYKVMGMAGFGKPKYMSKLKKLYKLFPDGSIQLDLDYFSYHHDTQKMFNRKLIKLLGEPREPGKPFFTSKMKYPTYYEKGVDLKKEAKKNDYYADIAASLQRLTEEIILTQVRFLHKETGETNLCLAGGVALNGLANGRIVKETPIKNLFIQPAAGDSGGAMGSALYVSNFYENKKHKFVLDSAYLGPEYSKKEILAAISKNKLNYTKLEYKKLINKVTDSLSKGKVVGWYQGRLEWGPRALGNRSILADPRNAKMKDLINVKVKFREPFRPFAPVVITTKAKEYFDLPNILKSQPAKFMTIVCNVLKDKKRVIPAGVHVDGTGRLQVIDRKTNPRYFDVIKKFGEKTGVYVLINTSFNLKGEPIVCSPEDAISTYLRSGIDVLVLGDYFITKI